MRVARTRAGRLAAIAAAGALALAGCGGGGGDGAEDPPGSTAATAPAPEKPTLAASQEIVDLVNGYTAELTDATGGGLDPAELEQRAENLREGSEAVTAKVVAHPCVERLATGQASLMETLADFLQAAGEGRADDAAAASTELQRSDAAAMVREAQACQARVGYRGPQGS